MKQPAPRVRAPRVRAPRVHALLVRVSLVRALLVRAPLVRVPRVQAPPVLRRAFLLLFSLSLLLVSPAGWSQEKFSKPFLDGLAKDASRASVSPDYWQQTRKMLEREGISPLVIERDRYQPEFLESLHRYTTRRLDAKRIARGQKQLAKHAALLERLQIEYGVPREILVAIWGLESRYGDITGRFPVLLATATLSAEGRRSAFFRKQFLTALLVAEREGFAPHQMLGSWAGAMGQMQFIPTTYWQYARDGDGDGDIDVWHNVDDALTSAAHYLKRSRWRENMAWGGEVRLPRRFDFTLADRQWRKNAFWRKKGIKSAHKTQKKRLLKNNKSRLLLPSGAAGPVFLVSENFRSLLRWNNSSLYALAVGLLADRLQGAPGLLQKPVEQSLRKEDIRRLQQRLNALGFDAGLADAVFGNQTRQALQRYQQREGLVPDGFPSLETWQKLEL